MKYTHVPVCVQSAVTTHYLTSMSPASQPVVLHFEPEHSLWCRIAARDDCKITPVPPSWAALCNTNKHSTCLWRISPSLRGTHLLSACSSCPRMALRSMRLEVGVMCPITGRRVMKKLIPTDFGIDVADCALQDALARSAGTQVYVDLRLETKQISALHEPDACVRAFATLTRDLLYRWMRSYSTTQSTDANAPSHMMHTYDVAGPMQTLTAADALVLGIPMHSLAFFATGVVECECLNGSNITVPWHFVAINRSTSATYTNTIQSPS